MIHLHKLNGEEFVLNANHIEVIDTTPNTVITLTNGKKYVVKESAEEVIKLTVEYKKEIYQSFR
ncbi:MAG TPA: flagellar FlbD family protein [Spirochaetota bacterium]|nr:flagellar FlbD family protein [Spirochaetota bacterium]HPS86991.1 flagellar FlbD family protein [Spirochaetota bacterium]